MLDSNSVTSLEKIRFILTILTELEEISVNRCEIGKITLRVFSGLVRVNFALLSMCGNKLLEMTPHTFEKMNRLANLVLVDNFIEPLEVDILWGLINLEYFYLSKNKLQAIPPDVFLGLSKI